MIGYREIMNRKMLIVLVQARIVVLYQDHPTAEECIAESGNILRLQRACRPADDAPGSNSARILSIQLKTE